MAKKCVIDNCEENAFGFYPLCKKHLEQTKTGQVYKDDTGKWRETSSCAQKKVDIHDEKPSENECILCGEPISANYKFCKDCYYNIQDRMDELDKNQHPQKLKDYYYHAKDYAMRIFNDDKVYYQELTMAAIAKLLEQLYDDDGLSERLIKDITVIEENLQAKNDKLASKVKEEKKINEIKADKDKSVAGFKRTQDGHFVASEFEIKVDDILYNCNIIHAYGIKVDEIVECTRECDWFIPVAGGKGIYVELWGMKGDEKYNKNKREKIELYKKHNLKLIEIEYDELYGDTQRLKSSLMSKIKTLKNEILEQMMN